MAAIKMIHKQIGFTAIELMIAVTIVAILAIMSQPLYCTITRNNNLANTSNEFVAVLNFIRSEAIKRGDIVALCPAGDANYNSCANNSNWSAGWIAFLDFDGNGVPSNSGDIIRVFQNIHGKNNISGAQNTISFNGIGISVNGATSYNASANVCSVASTRTIDIANTGRISVR